MRTLSLYKNLLDHTVTRSSPDLAAVADAHAADEVQWPASARAVRAAGVRVPDGSVELLGAEVLLHSGDGFVNVNNNKIKSEATQWLGARVRCGG